MIENEMGNRGSKSEPKKVSVKEQRVDGSWCFNNKLSHLRYTLMAFERNYPIKNPSKQLNISSFSTLASGAVENKQVQWHTPMPCTLFNNTCSINP